MPLTTHLVRCSHRFRMEKNECSRVTDASHLLTHVERKWFTYDKELWAIVRNFRHYLSSGPFTIITNHRPLLSLRKLDVNYDPFGRRDRSTLELDPYHWTIT